MSISNKKRQPGNVDNYVQDGDEYKCKQCGSTILGARVQVGPSWFLSFSNDISKMVPYCPKCDEEPTGWVSRIIEVKHG